MNYFKKSYSSVEGFKSIKNLDDQAKSNFKNNDYQKGSLTGSYKLKNSSFPISGAKYLISKFPETRQYAGLKKYFNNDVETNVLFAAGLNFLDSLKKQNILYQNIVDYIGNNFTVSGDEVNISIHLEIKVKDFFSKVLNLDLKSLMKDLHSDYEDESKLFFDKNPTIKLTLKGEKYKNSEVYLLDRIIFDTDFPWIISPPFISALVNEKDSSRILLSLLPDLKSSEVLGKNGGIIELRKQVDKKFKMKYLILLISFSIGVICLYILFNKYLRS